MRSAWRPPCATTPSSTTPTSPNGEWPACFTILTTSASPRPAGCDEDIIGAMLSHVPWNQDDFPRDRPIRKTLFACDELCGFIYAAALVRPDRLNGMQPSSITKKMKDKAFARAVSRDDIQQGAALLNLPLAEHIANCIAALQSIADQLELAPPSPK